MRNLFEILKVKNKIAIYRELGGLGDILMHRMIFEDMKLLWPGVEITFACPKKYHEAVVDHPFIDKVIDFNQIKPEEYLAVYDTSRTCYRTEMAQAPYVKDHRSDIWAKTCGLDLTKHDMNITISDEEIARAKKLVPSEKYALIAPVTAMNSKNLDPHQMKGIEKYLSKNGFDVFYIHERDLPEYGRTVCRTSIREMMAVIYRSSLVVSADTAAFHLAGGMKKPVVGIFGWADGKIYGKYFSKFQLVQKHRDDDPDWQCGPCFKFYACEKCPLKVVRKPCITEITPEMIIQGIERAIKRMESLPVCETK